MGNYKFRLSDMIPNAWFHKLKDMSKSPRKKPSNTTAKKKRSSHSLPHHHHHHHSNFSNRLHACSQAPFQLHSPRNSCNMTRAKRKTVYKPSPPSPPSASAGFMTDWSHNKSKITGLHNQDSADRLFPVLESSSESFAYSFDDDFILPASFDDQLATWSHSSNLVISSSAEDIIIDMKNNAFTRKPLEEIKGSGSVSTKVTKACPASNQTDEVKKGHASLKITKEREEHACRIQKKLQKPVTGGRKSFAKSQGIKLRANSPRIEVSARRSVSKSQSKRVVDSFAVIKRSVDPKKDFRESMLEMITENNIRASKDLEDLLACYLSLNLKEYHDVIIKAFEKIWSELKNSYC